MMKTFFTLLALFTLISGLAGLDPPSPTNPPPPPPPPPPSPCKARVPDDYLTTGTYRGSFIETMTTKTYHLALGTYVEAVYYTGGMSMFNETFTYIEGGTGRIIAKGWTWFLVKDGVQYSMTGVNGNVTHCTRGEGYTIDKYSTIIGGLNTLYPIPGEPVDPDIPNMCEGILTPTRRNPGCIMTVGWTPGTTTTIDPLVFLTTVSNTTSFRTKIRVMRPLIMETDKTIFHNPCKTTETVSLPSSVRWSGSARHLIRHSIRS